MVAAKRLAPSAQNKTISELFLSGPQPSEELGPAQALTKQSRQILLRSLNAPSNRRMKANGEFEGVVREVDLDARRFEIRGRGASVGMRCSYEAAAGARRRVLDQLTHFAQAPHGHPMPRWEARS